MLIAPGDLPIEGADVPPGDLTTRLDTSELTRVYLRLLKASQPVRVRDDRHRCACSCTAWLAIVRWTGASRPSIATPRPHCSATSAWDKVGTTGVGYYAHYAPQLHPDPADVPMHLNRLAMIKGPVLVIKPACDYLPWSATAGYLSAFTQARIVMIPDAGHVAYLEQPALYTSLVNAFLSGQQLPLPILDGTTIPDGYRGTR